MRLNGLLPDRIRMLEAPAGISSTLMRYGLLEKRPLSLVMTSVQRSEFRPENVGYLISKGISAGVGVGAGAFRDNLKLPLRTVKSLIVTVIISIDAPKGASARTVILLLLIKDISLILPTATPAVSINPAAVRSERSLPKLLPV